MKYIVINVCDRDIFDIGVADTLTEATEIMRNDFMEIFLEYYEKEDFENGNYRADEWQFNETIAWLNGRMDYDWRIVEVK